MSIISSTVTGSKYMPITPQMVIDDKRFNKAYTLGAVYSPPYLKSDYYVCKKVKATNPYRIVIHYSNRITHNTLGKPDEVEISVVKVVNGTLVKVEDVVSIYDWRNRILKNYFDLQ